MTTVYPQWRNQWIPQFYIDQWTVTCFKTMMWYMCSIMFSGTLFTHEWASCLLVPWRLFDDRMSTTSIAWWRHQTERFSALLAICTGNSPVPGKFPVQRPVTRSFDVFFDLRLNKRLSKQWRGWWFETHSPPLWRHSNVFIYIDGYQERTCAVFDCTKPYGLILRKYICIFNQFSKSRWCKWFTQAGSAACRPSFVWRTVSLIRQEPVLVVHIPEDHDPWIPCMLMVGCEMRFRFPQPFHGPTSDEMFISQVVICWIRS